MFAIVLSSTLAILNCIVPGDLGGALPTAGLEGTLDLGGDMGPPYPPLPLGS